jgi:plastocyanin
MRRPLVLTLAVTVALTLAGTATASTVAGKAPVKLSGKVNDHGTKKAKGGEIELEADDVYFEPTYVRAKKGQTVSVTITNEGSLQHTFTIDKQDIDETIDGGASVTVEVKVPKNGKPLAAYCRFHKGAGMQMAFFSKTGTKAKSTSNDGGSSGGFGY